MAKTIKKTEFVTVNVRLSGDTLDSLKKIAELAGTDVNTVANVVLALALKKATEDQ